MAHTRLGLGIPAVLLAILAGAVSATKAEGEIPGVTGPAFALTAKADRISTPDGHSIYFWGFTTGARAQYPGTTLIVEQGQVVTISVTNQLPLSAGQRVSLTFPGQGDVTAACTAGTCVSGPITLEANAGATVTYTFTASRPGTFQYASASQPDLQIEMGLVGALIVRPAGGASQAYAATETAYDREYLFLLTEMDSHIHDLVEQQGVDAVYQTKLLTNYFPNYWFINGRNAPDTMAENGIGRLPTQPYGALVTMNPGQKVLMRVIGGGRALHPFHHHGNHARVIAVDGNLLSTQTDPVGLSHEVFTIQSVPGQTVDAIFTWTGQGLGWDAYGDPTDPMFAHQCSDVSPVDGFDDTTWEYCADHGKKLPVKLPDLLSTDFGGFWSGSPFLGTLALLPPGQGGLNPNAGFTYMWHSHTEKEITNFDIFPGGMMTMLVVEPRR